jgi:ABC-type dipeptide/oligopeptide/nickel transport system permease subunit
MKKTRLAALVVLGIVAACSFSADLLSPAPYAKQFREYPNASPSRQFPLGTDELGRDRLSRLLHGSRVSLIMAPAAAFLSTLVAALLGVSAGFLGGWWERRVLNLADLFLSLPWFFLLLTVRAMLPLNVSPVVSVLITFTMLGLLGWAGSARVIRAGARSLREADFVLHARACGTRGARLVLRHMLPNLKPILLAQFWISVPLFILAEANLGLLGLGVTEPLPSWGGLLRELENYPAVLENPWMLAPVVLLIVVVGSLQLALAEEVHSGETG